MIGSLDSLKRRDCGFKILKIVSLACEPRSMISLQTLACRSTKYVCACGYSWFTVSTHYRRTRKKQGVAQQSSSYCKSDARDSARAEQRINDLHHPLRRNRIGEVGRHI
jgi:hypothetical protein